MYQRRNVRLVECLTCLSRPKLLLQRSMLGGRARLDRPTSTGLYGEVVGNFPAVSSASRCALSEASCVAFSFGLNVPLGGAPCGLDGVPAAGVLLCVVVVAAPLEAAPNSVAPTAPPPSSDPAIAAVMMPLRIGLMVFLFHVLYSLVYRGQVSE